MGFAADNVEIYYGHEIEDYAAITSEPRDRDGFIQALRQFALQAKFKD